MPTEKEQQRFADAVKRFRPYLRPKGAVSTRDVFRGWLPMIEAERAAGASWAAVTHALAEAGFRSADTGRALKENAVRALWSQLRDQQQDSVRLNAAEARVLLLERELEAYRQDLATAQHNVQQLIELRRHLEAERDAAQAAAAAANLRAKEEAGARIAAESERRRLEEEVRGLRNFTV